MSWAEFLTLAPGSDRIPVELFQILKDDAVESAALNMQYAGSRHLPSHLFFFSLAVYLLKKLEHLSCGFPIIGHHCLHPCVQVGHTPASCLFPPDLICSGQFPLLEGILADCVTVFSPKAMGRSGIASLTLSVARSTVEVT